ncbi:MAG: hypothetical protein LBK07_07110 [Tannerella sp.]|nr:hypothetical protein [Tannerella sp.]
MCWFRLYFYSFIFCLCMFICIRGGVPFRPFAVPFHLFAAGDKDTGFPEEKKVFTGKNILFPKNIFGVPEKSFGIPEKSFGVPGKYFGIPKKYFGIPGKNFGIPKKCFGVPGKYFGIPEKCFWHLNFIF